MRSRLGLRTFLNVIQTKPRTMKVESIAFAKDGFLFSRHFFACYHRYMNWFPIWFSPPPPHHSLLIDTAEHPLRG